MTSFSKKSAVRPVSLGLSLAFCTLGASVVIAPGCSSSSSPAAPSSDASVEAVAPSPLGVPVPSCAGCTVCGGVLGSPTTGISYCTVDCAADDSDCPSGTACALAPETTSLANECLKTCASDTDCTSPFICRSDLPSPGSFCWSPYPPPGDAGTSVSDAGPDAAPDGGAAIDAGDASAVDSGALDAASDGGLGDASADAASE